MDCSWQARLIVAVALSVGCKSDLPPPPVTDGPMREGGTLNIPAFASFGELCQPAPTLSGDCLTDDDCATGVCRRDNDASIVDMTRPPLACAAPGSGAAVGDRCTLDADCARGLCVAAGTCVMPCGVDDDCPTEQRCKQVWLRSGEDSMQQTFACIDRLSLPAGVSAVRSENVTPDFIRTLGSLSIGGVTLPPGSGLSLVESTCGDGLQSIGLVTNGGDPVVLFDSMNPGAERPLNGLAGTLSPMPVLIPNGPDVVLSGSGYTYELLGRTLSDVTVTTMELGSGGALDIDLFYVGGGDFAPEGARGPSSVSAAFDRFEEIYAGTSITIGEVRQHELVGGLRDRLERLDLLESTNDLARLLQLSAGADGPSAAVFLVQELDPFGGLLGIAGGIPGPLGRHGTSLSGIAIAVDQVGTILGEVLAHELGHFLGLFHTRELIVDDVFFNPLTDVPTTIDCFELDDDGNIVFTGTPDCVAALDNLMFPIANSGADLTFQQREVVRRAPIFRR